MFAASPSCASISYVQEKGSGPVELLRKLSRDVATYFNVTDVQRRHSEVSKKADIKALVMDLMDTKVHTFTRGRAVGKVDPDKGKGVADIFMEGKVVLERGAFRNWKDRTGKLAGADIFGINSEYEHQQEVVAGQHRADSVVDADSQDNDNEAPIEFDALADPEMEDESMRFD